MRKAPFHKFEYDTVPQEALDYFYDEVMSYVKEKFPSDVPVDNMAWFRFINKPHGDLDRCARETIVGLEMGLRRNLDKEGLNEHDTEYLEAKIKLVFDTLCVSGRMTPTADEHLSADIKPLAAKIIIGLKDVLRVHLAPKLKHIRKFGTFD